LAPLVLAISPAFVEPPQPAPTGDDVWPGRIVIGGPHDDARLGRFLDHRFRPLHVDPDQPALMPALAGDRGTAAAWPWAPRKAQPGARFGSRAKGV